jgi:hypothetical protein
MDKVAEDKEKAAHTRFVETLIDKENGKTFGDPSFKGHTLTPWSVS